MLHTRKHPHIERYISRSNVMCLLSKPLYVAQDTTPMSYNYVVGKTRAHVCWVIILHRRLSITYFELFGIIN